MIRGKHDIKVGATIRANQMNVGAQAFQDGFWIPAAIGNFSGFASNTVNVAGNAEADVLLGLAGVAEHDQTFNGPVTGRRWKIFQPFVQDDWRITRDLTLNLAFALPNKLEYLGLAGAPLRHHTARPSLGKRPRAMVFPRDFRSLTVRQPPPPHLPELFLRNPGTSISVWSSSSMRTWSARCRGILCSPLAMPVLAVGISWSPGTI